MSAPDVLVVGAGLAGLGAAALLAREGIMVTLVEEEQDVGGRLQSLTRDGFRLDAGLHCFHYGDSGPLGGMDRELGLELEYLEDRNSSYILKGKDRLPILQGAEMDRAEVQGLTEDEAARVKDLYSRLMEADAGKWGRKTMASFLAEAGFEEDELVAGYAGALCLTVLGRSPEQVSAGNIISHLQESGGLGIRVSAISGGPGRLIEALTKRIGSDHARTIMGSRVLEIRVRDRKVSQVVTSSEEFSPAAVIYTGPVRSLPDLVSGEKPDKAFIRMCKKLVPISGIILEFGLSASISEIRGALIDPEEAVIGRFASNLDPILAPEGCQISSWLALVEGDDLEDVKATRSHIKRLMRLIKRQFPEFMDHVKWERLRVIPAIAGAAPLSSQPKEKRPPVALKEIKNLFLAGDGIWAKGLLSGAAISSAMEAAGKVKKLLQKVE